MGTVADKERQQPTGSEAVVGHAVTQASRA
jgi:hypothetical protein